MKRILFIIVTFILVQMNNAQTNTFDYLGQTPPGDTAVIFAPGIISKPDRFDDGIAFSPDGNELFYSANGKTESGIYYTKRVNNIWTEHVRAPFAGSENASSPFLCADGNKLYFGKDGDIWMVERTLGGWGEPQRLPSPINTTSNDYAYSETADGVGYFTSNRPDGIGNMDIWQVSSMPNNTFQVENLGSIVNSSNYEYMSCIAHDGSYLIYNTFRYTNYSEQDLWITFKKKNNEWTIPISMEKNGAKINVANYNQLDPSLSPDGKYLFFSRENKTNDQRDIYWVSTHVIVGLKKTAYAPKLSNQIPNASIKADTVFNYVIPGNTFSCEYGTDSLKYSASLSNGSALPSWLTFNAETRTLSGTPKQAEVFNIKIIATNADTASATCTFKITVTKATGIEESNNNLPNEFQLCQNYPIRLIRQQ